MPKKGIFEKFLNSFLCFFSYPISNQFPIFSHSSLLAAAPLGPFSGPRKAGGEARSCLFSWCQPCSQAGDRMSNLHIISSSQLPGFLKSIFTLGRQAGDSCLSFHWEFKQFFFLGVAGIESLTTSGKQYEQTHILRRQTRSFTWSVNTKDGSHAIKTLY